MRRRRPSRVLRVGVVFFGALGVLATGFGIYAARRVSADGVRGEEAIALGPLTAGLVALALAFALWRTNRSDS